MLARLPQQIAARAEALAGPAVLALLLGACSSGPGGEPALAPASAQTGGSCSAADDCGTVLIAVTDADGDFVSYAVDVLSVTLHRSGGGSVETLPRSTRIDFAELADLSELLSAATLAPGDIGGGTIRLDYSAAEIHIESGGRIVPAIAVDSAGKPLTVVDLEIRLADDGHLLVTRGRTAFLSIDFDLAASHDVDLAATPARVTARPYLVAEVRPVEEKELRVRGALVDVDPASGSYEIRVRPWHDRGGDFGIATVATTDWTSFEIGDAAYVGAAGLRALDALEPSTLTVAFGTLDVRERTFTAAIVHAGDSVGGGRYAAVHGNVVARSGDRLTVWGAIVVHRDRPAHFQRAVVVEIGPATGVGKVGDPLAVLDKDAVSVGQRIVALGQLADETGTAPGDAPLILDATEGRVRMLVTRLSGTVTGVLPGQVDLRLRAIDRLAIDMFDFAGTGISSAGDADPLDYEVATGTLSLSGIEIDEAARVLGFVAPFGEAPPDFLGRTVVGPRDIPAALGIGWGPSGTRAPFLSIEPTGLVPDLANPDIGLRHHLLLGSRLVDLFDLAGPPAVQASRGRSIYGIAEPGRVELFTDFAEFGDALALRIANGDRVWSLAAHGAYDAGANVLGASRAVVQLLPAQ